LPDNEFTAASDLAYVQAELLDNKHYYVVLGFKSCH